MACLLEVTAPKPGNVHRCADFEDVTFLDFAMSAVAIGPAMEQASAAGVGQTVLSAIQATRQVTRTNTNLGTVLLLAPLAAVPHPRKLAEGVKKIMGELSADDSRLVYEAIRLAQPGGLGEVDKLDVRGEAPASLLDAMREAAHRDLIARQYVTDFETVFSHVVPEICAGVASGGSLTDTIIYTHVKLLSQFPDSLIARKCGRNTADIAACKAALVLKAGRPHDENYQRAVADLDFWLRSDFHRRNPGTTADLIAAGLFVAIREDKIPRPFS
jgi:triphosphoribosyl-dephospho-CoA synthase